jgi:uracil phosphoribosyltransferase
MGFCLSEIEHRYGAGIHILKDPVLETWLARLCSPQTVQPQINQLVEFLYTSLVRVVLNSEFSARQVHLPTRMTAAHPEAPYEGEILSDEQRAVTVNLARAGTWPSHICYTTLNHILNPLHVRQDHILASRLTDDRLKVTGTQLAGAKIGGDVKDAIVLFPDPMGATGNTLISALNHYKTNIAGPARKYVALHLIVTPEYLKNVHTAHPDVVIYAVRLDRGLSTSRALKAIPGTYWDEERGLNDKHYIVPGGGGFGEIMNNSFV